MPLTGRLGHGETSTIWEGKAMAKAGEIDGVRRGSRWRIAAWGAAALLLALPFVAMRFTAEVTWTAFDFAFLGALLAGVGLGLELAVRRSGNLAYRIAAGLALAAAFLLILINGAVGIIGSEREGANLLYGLVLAVALLGAILARFRPAGMARAMAAAALVQSLVPAVAPAIWPDAMDMVWAPEVLVLTGFFAALWLGSAWLFRQAARTGQTR
jgi:hypothetical protein